MTDTSTANIFQQIEAQLSTEWAGAASFLKAAEQDIGSFLTKFASGAEIVISDIEAVGQYVAGHLTVINASIASLASIATVVAPNNVTAQKVIADLNTSAQDVAALSTALSSGSSAGSPQIVSTAASAIGAVQQLAQLANNAGATLTTLALNSSTATQAVTPAAGA